ncbi:uncharacterized protein BKCO1_10000144 [Diplodia corticola]|uniref:NADH dehydrogenase [ubiquinone] 1 alpha subcomplex assembly factor 3 n=1 Tax=Diplodia corticola TaxID=236234 RepID=A0A1J9R8Z2_9PEZI|nr:uncharacterized protein BKCO1_10000144 [Diplodia corticola]OJD36642.1 hypothetical protein BKCO1_10000144 [Diplodia corticola]
MPPPSALSRAALRALLSSSSSRRLTTSSRLTHRPTPTPPPTAARLTASSSSITTTKRHQPLHTSARLHRSNPPVSHDRGPPSSEETQTDFDKLDVLGNMPAPTTAVDATFDDGFSLNSGLHVGGMCGVLLVAGDAFVWRPWVRGDEKEGGKEGEKKKTTLRNERNMWECDRAAWGALELVWPKPDLLIIGTGATVVPVSPTTRKHINDLGIRLEVSDTRNAAAQFNLLATERGVQQVAAALVPMGWKEDRAR